MPNQLRNALKYVAFFCNDNLSCPPDVHNTANLNQAVSNAAAMLRKCPAGDQAEELCSKWAKVCEWEDEIDTLEFIHEDTGPALKSWTSCMSDLHDSALAFVASELVAAAEGRKFDTSASPDSSPMPVDNPGKLVIINDPRKPCIEWQGKQHHSFPDGTCEAFQKMLDAKGKPVGIGSSKPLRKPSDWYKLLPKALKEIVNKDGNKGYFLTINFPPDSI